MGSPSNHPGLSLAAEEAIAASTGAGLIYDEPALRAPRNTPRLLATLRCDDIVLKGSRRRRGGALRSNGAEAGDELLAVHKDGSRTHSRPL